MSHVARVRVQFKNLDHLAEACRRVGLELVRDQAMYYKARGCEHAIRPKSAEQLDAYKSAMWSRDVDFPFGVQRTGDNEWGVLFESTQSGFCQPLVGELKKAYAAAAAIATARASGFRVQERRLSNGKIQLMFSK
jgi:hypothetical protein